MTIHTNTIIHKHTRHILYTVSTRSEFPPPKQASRNSPYSNDTTSAIYTIGRDNMPTWFEAEVSTSWLKAKIHYTSFPVPSP